MFVQLGKLAETRGETAPSLRSIDREQRKVLHRQNIEALILLSNYLTPEEIAALEGLFSAAGLNMRTVFGDHLRRTYQDGLDMAFDWMKDGHPSDRRNRARTQNPERFAGVPELYLVNEDSPFFKSFYDDALQTITSKVSIFFKGEAFSIIGNGISSGLNWRQIASDIRKDVGTGALWHWKRLVRTELANAYDRSMSERYHEAGIEFVKRSVARGACPICVSQKGIYKLGEQPRVTGDSHPNCRCTYIPFYALPAGSESRGPWIET